MPDRKIFLASSNNIQPETYSHFQGLLGRHPRETRVGFIPSVNIGPQNDIRKMDAINFLHRRGFTVEIINLRKENYRTIRHHLEWIQLLYVSGGNTFDLLQWMVMRELREPLQERVANGMCYYGSSAGSLVAGPNIELARYWDKNRTRLQNFRGMELTDIAVFPPFRTEHVSTLASGINDINYRVVAITKQQAVIVDGTDYRIVGDGKAQIFNPSQPKAAHPQPLAVASQSR